MGRKATLATGLVLGLMGATQALAQQQSAASDTTHADDVKAALSAYRRGDYSPLLKIVQPRAAKGDAGARTILGLIYEDGKGVPKDDGKAANLFGQAALWGCPGAEAQLGTLYFQGRIGNMRNPVVGYALSKDGMNYTSDQQERQAIHAKLDSEGHSMTFDQVTQARVLADEIKRLGLLATMRDYLGNSAADQVLCQVPVGPNVCHESIPGSPPMAFTVDANGRIHEDDKQPSLAELKDRFMVMAVRAPQPEVIVTVDSNGALATEMVQLLLNEARGAGIALVSVVPGNSLESVPQAGVHHLSFISGEAEAGPDGEDIPVAPAVVVPRFRPDRQPVLVWLDERGKVTAVRLDTRYPVAKPDGEAVQKAAQFSYQPCLNGDAGTPCMMEVWVPASTPLQLDTTSGAKHELAIVPVSVLTRTNPTYPADAITALHEGVVTLYVHISAKGLPQEITMSQTSGFHELDDAAKNAVTNWTFKPQTIEGVAVDSYMKIPVSFGLNRTQAK
jgi:TonB family protein